MKTYFEEEQDLFCGPWRSAFSEKIVYLWWSDLYGKGRLYVAWLRFNRFEGHEPIIWAISCEKDSRFQFSRNHASYRLYRYIWLVRRWRKRIWKKLWISLNSLHNQDWHYRGTIKALCTNSHFRIDNEIDFRFDKLQKNRINQSETIFKFHITFSFKALGRNPWLG